MKRSSPPNRALTQVPPFSQCSRRDRRQVERLTCELTVDAGTVLAEQGHLVGQYIVIADGTAEEMLDGHPIATLDAGDDFGGTGLLARTTHPSTIRARTPMVLEVMSTQEFLTAYSTIPAVHDRVEDEPARIARRWNVPTAPVAAALHADPSLDYTFAS